VDQAAREGWRAYRDDRRDLRETRQLELTSGSTAFVQLDPQGIHIMPARHGAGGGRA
jgi:hypothetical protein